MIVIKIVGPMARQEVQGQNFRERTQERKSDGGDSESGHKGNSHGSELGREVWRYQPGWLDNQFKLNDLAGRLPQQKA